jgi:hypothetical protein
LVPPPPFVLQRARGRAPARLAMPDRFRRLLASSVVLPLLLPGCGKLERMLGLEDEKREEGKEGKADKDGKTPGKGDDAPAPDIDGSAPPEPLARSDHKLRFPGKSGEHMGFDLDKLSKLRALAGAVEIPEWSSPGEGTERHVRDDDLRTAWSCRVRPEQPCAIGIHFPEPAEVEAVRLYAIPSGNKAPHARPKRVRVHTTEGWAEARMADEDREWHVLLGEPVRTRNLSLEVLETWGDGPLQLAELEVYGRSGVARDPLALDPAHAVITFETPVWRQKLRTNTAGPAFVETVDVDGRLRRLLPGSALVGRMGDRMLLVERASWSTCNDHQGAYDLLDTHTRVVVPLGDMGGFAGDVFRHAGGLGFAIGRADAYEAHAQGVVLDEGTYERRSTDRLEQRKPDELFAAWGMESTPLPHDDARPLDDPPTGCGPAQAPALAALRAHLPKRTKLVAAQWYACSMDEGSRLLLTTGGACGKQWHVAMLDAEGELVGERAGKQSGMHARLRRIDGGSFLVELWGSNDQPRLLLAQGDGLVDVGEATAFSLRPPAGCRKQCATGFEDLGPGS